MRIVTDSGMNLVPQMARDLDIRVVPHTIRLAGKTYRSEIDIDAETFYGLLETTGAFPTTSLPSPGEFAEVYRELAQTDPDIISIHMSSGLSATSSAARTAASMVPEANVTVFDSLTLSAAQGWLVETAARAANAGWSLERTVDLLQRVERGGRSIYTIKDLKYLIHGGRISHMKGLLGSVLRLNPIIGVEKAGGTYEQLGMGRTEKRAVKVLAKQMEQCYPAGSALRVQLVHGQNVEGLELLRKQVEQRYECHWLPTTHMTVVLGAHTGPSLVGIAFAPQALFADFPVPSVEAATTVPLVSVPCPAL